jgi:hypothetical protein
MPHVKAHLDGIEAELAEGGEHGPHHWTAVYTSLVETTEAGGLTAEQKARGKELRAQVVARLAAAYGGDETRAKDVTDKIKSSLRLEHIKHREAVRGH